MPSVFGSDGRVRCRLDRPDPFPVHTLKRVDRPTTAIQADRIQRVDERESGFNRSGRGDYGPFVKKERPRMVPKHPLSAALVTMQGMLGHLVDAGQALPVNPAPQNGPMPSLAAVAAQRAPGTDDPSKMARHIKETAYFLRADAVGICELPPYAVYSHSVFTGQPIDLTHKYAIGILVDQDWRTASAFSGRDWISNSMSFMSYSASGFIACLLADYIRRLGYPARAHHARNYQVVLPPIFLLAGLGEMSRIGDIVVHPFLGPRFKGAVVTTDLPLAVDKPVDFGLQDFCSKCKKCARECPSGAISDGGKVLHNGYEKWPVDVKKCTSMRVANQKGCGCGTCIKVCPWSKPFTPFHRLVNWTMRNLPAARNLAIWGDDLLGYGKARPEQKWWLDVEDVDGSLQVPKNAVEDAQFLDE
ncbi:MAG: reductive dehalogenase [Deltaproteobacteria bacterium]|nr:reductive dehalogenase [Deltaproteobacteria bacterium]